MNRLLKERKALRAVFVRTCGQIDQEPQGAEIAARGVELLNQLQDKYQCLEEVHNKILELMLSETTPEEEYEREFETAEQYRERYIASKCRLESRIAVRADSVIQGDVDAISNVSSRATRRRKFKLPLLKLRNFGGDPKDWLAFWGQFKQIHEDEDMVAEDKFQYLVQSMEAGSAAASLIDGFPPSAENYEEAVKLLQQRFAREDLLVQVYVR